MEETLDKLRAKGNVRNGADDRFYVSVRYREEGDGLDTLVAPFTNQDNIDAIMRWCQDNCIGAFEPFGNNTIVFEEQEDAILFLLRLRR
jgi:hypothetical protein